MHHEEQKQQPEQEPAQEASSKATRAGQEVSPEQVGRELNWYEQKLADRRERLQERAAKISDESGVLYQRAKTMASAIPFGQPILIGHHSEGRDRRYRDRIHSTYGKAFALQDKAKHYEQKAAAVGTGGISSDDPDAIEKLQAELQQLEANQQRMKAANQVIRKHKTLEARHAALVAQGFSESLASQILTPDCFGGIGFASYALSNNNANIRRIRQRIEDLQKRREASDVEVEADGYTYREDVDENRVMFIFPGKPDEPTRQLLRQNAFKWSPRRGAWVRQLNNAGRWAARQVRKSLGEALE
ncbi:TPA: DUF3560 domain-containing protein [Pseudomonas aeruginosa]